MTSERRLQDTIMAHGLSVEGFELPVVPKEDVSKSMQELHDIEVARLKGALDEQLSARAREQHEARDKDRGRRKHISSLYMGLWAMALLAAYMGFRR